jgi:hypothetical protein
LGLAWSGRFAWSGRIHPINAKQFEIDRQTAQPRHAKARHGEETCRKQVIRRYFGSAAALGERNGGL